MAFLALDMATSASSTAVHDVGMRRPRQRSISTDERTPHAVSPMSETEFTWRDAWHAHLDSCARCRNGLFALCAYGRVLLSRAGKEAEDELVRGIPPHTAGGEP